MKSILLPVALVLLTVTQAFAQVFTFGPKAGFTFNQFHVDEASLDEAISISDIPNERTVGVTAGAFLQLNLGPFVFQPELMFSHQSGQMTFSDLSFSDVQRISFNQVDIPMLVGFNLGRAVRVQAGPVMSYVLGVGSDRGVVNIMDAFVNDFENKSWGYQAGAGLDLGRLALDVRYGGSLGKRDVFFDVDGTTYPVSVSRNSILVTAGIAILK
ncbi:MAG: outer membrane beta-barrel protein [Bacteroidetes bacterium]|nr:outer membrane beta-barrel protein [Bacteroidota bacterium]